MKKLAQATAFLLGLTLLALAQANETLPLVAVCKSLDENKEFLEERYKEQPFAGGPSVVRMSDGTLLEGTGKIYVDPDQKGFTVLIEFVKINKSCVLLMGDEFAPIVSGEAS